MTILTQSALVGLSSLAAGFLGALTGLGGGVVIVPMLTLAFGVDIRYAIGASLVSVIATSSGAAAAYVKEGYTNLRVGMFLEIATTLGALAGAALAVVLPAGVVAVLFGLVLAGSAYLSSRPHGQYAGPDRSDRLASLLCMDSSYPGPNGPIAYHVRGIPAGFGLMFVAGSLSGLLGIGSGAVKVLALDQAMRLPFKVSTTTSNFMIGVTAAASAGIYLGRGDVDATIATPVALGVLAGATLGARLLPRLSNRHVRLVFLPVLIVVGAQMVARAAGIGL